MNEHFYNGFIKRAQAHGLSIAEAGRLAKLAQDAYGPIPNTNTPVPTSKFRLTNPTLRPDSIKETPNHQDNTPMDRLNILHGYVPVRGTGAAINEQMERSPLLEASGFYNNYQNAKNFIENKKKVKNIMSDPDWSVDSYPFQFGSTPQASLRTPFPDPLMQVRPITR